MFLDIDVISTCKDVREHIRKEACIEFDYDRRRYERMQIFVDFERRNFCRYSADNLGVG